MAEFRCDSFPIPKYEKRLDGFLSLMLPIAREGELTYFNADGSKRIEYVSRNTLKKSAHTFANQPLTLRHPQGAVTPQTAKSVQVGMSGRLMKLDDRGVLWVDATVTDAAAIDAIESGECQQLSCGYKVQTEQREDGIWEQVDRVGNHIAIVDRARGGSDLTIRVDDADAPYYLDESELTPPPIEQSTKPQKSSRKQRKDSMSHLFIGTKPFRIDSEDVTTIDAVQAEINKLIERADAAEAERNQFKVQLDSAEAEVQSITKQRDEVQARYDAAQTQDSAEPETRSDAGDLKTRIALIREVAPFMAKNLDGFNEDALYDLDPQQIKTAFLAVKRPDLRERLDSASSDYVEALYDASKPAPEVVSGGSRVDSILGLLAPTNNDSATPINQDAYEAKMAEFRKKRTDWIKENGKKSFAC